MLLKRKNASSCTQTIQVEYHIGKGNDGVGKRWKTVRQHEWGIWAKPSHVREGDPWK